MEKKEKNRPTDKQILSNDEKKRRPFPPKAAKNTELYARFDDLKSKDDWNIAKDEQAAIIGTQFKLGKYVKLAPNFGIANPKASGADNKCYAFINFYFGL
mgnify:CR=1 FL=1